MVYSHHFGELKALWHSMRWKTISIPSPNRMMIGTVTIASTGLYVAGPKRHIPWIQIMKSVVPQW